MLVSIGTTKLVAFEDITLPDLAVRQIDVMQTVEMQRILIDKGGSNVGMPVTVSGVGLFADIKALALEVASAVSGSAISKAVTITSGAVNVTYTGYITRVGGIQLIAGKVVYSDVPDIAVGTVLCRASVEMMLSSSVT